MKSTIHRVGLLFGLLAIALASPLPHSTKPKACPVFERGIMNFDDTSPGFIETNKGFVFPGVADWYVIGSSTSGSTPYHKGVTSEPNGLLSAFHWMTSFNAGSAFTFDLISLNLTALTSSTAARGKPYLKVKILGFRDGEGNPSAQEFLKVRNTHGGGGKPVYVKLGGDKWSSLDNVGIEVEDEEGQKGVPNPGEQSPGFILDDVVFWKRRLC